ncbi:MAG: GNAT family N-acetyltransferase [bacterium]|nr:GNAT family N-acetyltransferase [bacterium]
MTDGTVQPVAIRAARLADAEGIREIYNYEVLNGTSTFDIEPRSLAAQQSWLQDRSGVHAVLVATPDDDDDSVTGYASLSPFHTRPAYNTTVENSVYVHIDHRGEGVGRALLLELIALAQSHGFHTVIARISGGNEASVAVHRSAGFEVVGVEREVGRKFGRWLDVTVMQLMLRDWSGS